MIRKAENKDIEAIMRLLLQVNNVHADGRPDLFIRNVRKYTEDEVADIIRDPKTPVFVSTDDDDNLEGYCFCQITDHSGDHHLQPVKTLYIDDLCVDSELRGRHVGSRLYANVRQWAKDNGFYNLTLNVWACNESALRFYEAMGLRPQKTTLETLL